jgi:hypothetical protein
MARWFTLVHEPDAAIAVGGHQHDLREIEVEAVELSLLFQRRQCTAAQAGVVQVAHELRRPFSRYAADAQEHRELAAIAMPHPHVAPAAEDAGFAGREVTLQVIVMMIPVRGGHQHADVAAQRIDGPVAEHLFRGSIERSDAPAIVHDHDGVERGLEQGRNVGRGAPHGAQRYSLRAP